MDDTFFPAIILLPSAGFAYLSLATFYGWRRGYEAISWVPLALYLCISAFDPMREFAPASNLDFVTLLRAVDLLSVVQGVFGIGLTVRALVQHRPAALLFVSSVLAAVPFFLQFR